MAKTTLPRAVNNEENERERFHRNWHPANKTGNRKSKSAFDAKKSQIGTEHLSNPILRKNLTYAPGNI
jgi:hypothetical protein